MTTVAVETVGCLGFVTHFFNTVASAYLFKQDIFIVAHALLYLLDLLIAGLECRWVFVDQKLAVVLDLLLIELGLASLDARRVTTGAILLLIFHLGVWWGVLGGRHHAELGPHQLTILLQQSTANHLIFILNLV